MPKPSQQQILDSYDKLPQPVKEAMFSEATAEKMMSIGKRHGLLLDATGKLAEETGYVMVGSVHPRDFPRELSNALAVPPSKAREIAEDVNQQVFKPIREHLMKMFNIEDIPSGPMPAPAVSAAPRPSFATPAPKPPPVASFTPQSKPEAANLGAAHGGTNEAKAPPMIFPGRIRPDQIKPANPAASPTPEIKPTVMPKAPEKAVPPIPAAPHFENKPASPPPPKSPTSNDPYHEPIG